MEHYHFNVSEPHIQYEVDKRFDELHLDKDEKLIIEKLRANYKFKAFNNYDELKEKFDWYNSLSKKYKDEAYKNKFHALLTKAKKDGIEYMLILQDLLFLTSVNKIINI